MLKDHVLAGIKIGLLADLVKLAINYAAYLLNFTGVVFWQIVATRFLDKKYLFEPAAYLIGGIADITVTVALGILFCYVLDFTGQDNLWIKGIGFAMSGWGFLVTC